MVVPKYCVPKFCKSHPLPIENLPTSSVFLHPDMKNQCRISDSYYTLQRPNAPDRMIALASDVGSVSRRPKLPKIDT